MRRDNCCTSTVGDNVMPAIVLIGAQWGDEGKGKATDLLGVQLQWVVRYQGGNKGRTHRGSAER